MPLTTESESHRRLTRFVDWIKTPDDKEDDIRTQAEEIRSQIKNQATKDGLVVRSTPTSGSYAKRTGLRRHWNPKGGMPIEGQDVDLPFVVSPSTRDGERLSSLLARFESYAKASYPKTTRTLTKSSVVLKFVSTKLSYDLVPMLATDKDDEQVLLRGDGERRRTSVQKHVEFVRGRNRQSNELKGRVKFNEMLRLLKWWREYRVTNDRIVDELPTIVIELLAAKVFDENSVGTTYTGTMQTWFEALARIIDQRERVAFTDFQVLPRTQGHRWEILDPVNPQNNVVPERWTERQIDQLATWCQEAAQNVRRAAHYEQQGDTNNMVHEFCQLFGSPFKHHSDR